MKYFEELNQFLDGNLPAEKEQELFLAMSSSDELRRAFRRMSAIRSGMSAHASRLSAPQSSKAAIMAGLGIAPRQTGFARIRSQAKRFSREIMVAATAAALSISLMAALYNPKDDAAETNLLQAPVVTFEPASVAMEIPESAEPAPVVSSFEWEPAMPERNIPPVEDVLPSEEIIAEVPARLIASAAAYPNPAVYANSLSFAEPREQRAEAGSGMLIDQVSAQSQGVAIEGIAIEFFGNDHIYFEDPTVSPQFVPGFHNKSISISYSPTDNISIGVSARNENFFLEYEGIDRLGLPVRYEQQPNLLTFQGDVRLAWNNSSIVDPFIQLSAGGNKYGAIARTASGLIISPIDRFAFLVSIEYSSLWYQHQQAAFRAEKIGLNYGVHYTLF